jgi:hypothetical protein
LSVSAVARKTKDYYYYYYYYYYYCGVKQYNGAASALRPMLPAPDNRELSIGELIIFRKKSARMLLCPPKIRHSLGI